MVYDGILHLVVHAYWESQLDSPLGTEKIITLKTVNTIISIMD